MSDWKLLLNGYYCLKKISFSNMDFTRINLNLYTLLSIHTGTVEKIIKLFKSTHFSIAELEHTFSTLMKEKTKSLFPWIRKKVCLGITHLELTWACCLEKWYTPTILIVESWDYPGSKFDFRRTTLGWTSWHLNGEHENISNSICIFFG